MKRTHRDASEVDPETLDPLSFPLYGSRLVEASAGTGKTYTIAALYVRLVLGHGGDAGFARPLTPPEILVVTFTEAATKELRDRIRARLTEAARLFQNDVAAVSGREDALLLEIRGCYPVAEWPACARRLQLAAEWMDEAAVSTIHGWCNRMLREHAFDSGSLFSQALETDQSELLAEVVRDYWRCFMVPLDADSVAEVLRWWSGPADLQAAIGGLIGHADLLEAEGPPAPCLATARAQRRRRLAELKAPWTDWVTELQALLDTARERKAFSGTGLKKLNYDKWLATIACWRDDDDRRTLELSASARSRLSTAGLAAIWKSPPHPRHPSLDALESLDAELARLPDARNDILRHAAGWVAERFAVEQQRRARMGFDDLLTQLGAALEGANGARLAARIRGSFPVAMIDEFQDTDPVQYRIFDSVYRVADNAPDTALVLIGDPKQAIYSFRGADIHTYLAARRDCHGRLYTLARNYRSTTAMVAATNRCFAFAEARAEGPGAFLFRSAAGNPVPFVEAEAHGRKDRLLTGDAAALTAWWLPGREDGRVHSKEAYFTQMAAACASEMVRLLDLGQQGDVGFGPGSLRSLRPADLAVLVKDRNEAAAIRDALAERGVRSVYLSDRESVFQAAQAVELRHWLSACAEPDDPRLLRAALATPTLGLRWAELDALNCDERAWEARVLQFRDYRECWRRQGVLPMLRRLINDFDLPARLIARDGGESGGERVLTDLLHLAELLQQASARLDGEHALIRHLAEQSQRAGSDGDARQIRLESDADLVQVVTVHKSKGLEYPLVFLPFACSYREVKSTDLPLIVHDDQGRLQITLEADTELRARADRERLGEDLRRLYVALTRARYATWVGVAAIAGVEKSAIGYLLSGGAPIPPDGLRGALEALRGSCAEIRVSSAPASSNARFVSKAGMRAMGVACVPRRAVSEPWWIASYSALKTVSGADRAAAEGAREEVLREAIEMPRKRAEDMPEQGALHAFPRGAEVGTFLHDLLEWAARQGFANVATDDQLRRDTIAGRCRARGWSEWVDTLTDWLGHFLAVSLELPAAVAYPATCTSLATLDVSMAEMEFWVEAHGVDTTALDALVCKHALAGAARPQLQPELLNGMLKGFIDLLFEHQGRYYVVDYKSNWLGRDDSAYTAEAMQAAILHSRYELQYVLYLFALHRLLKARLPDYDYDRHVGGAAYLFLRGSRAPSQGLHFERPPRALIEALDDLFAARVARRPA